MLPKFGNYEIQYQLLLLHIFHVFTEQFETTLILYLFLSLLLSYTEIPELLAKRNFGLLP